MERRTAPRTTTNDGETTMTIMVEIRAAEGGADARMLVLEQFKIYGKRCSRRCL